MSWQQQKLAEFCKTGSGSTPSRAKASEYYGGTIPWVKSGELKEGEIIDTEETVTEKALAETAIKMVPRGALLIAMYGATVGRMAFLGNAATTNQAVCHIIVDPTVCEDRYLFYCLQNMVPQLLDKRVGGGQPNISQQIIKNLEIPLPPLAEQKGIAAVLDKADAIRRKRQQAVQLADEFLRAVFLDMFGDPMVNPKGWLLVELGQVCNSVTYGTSSKASDNKDGIPILRMNNITREGKVDLSSLRYIRLKTHEKEKYTLRRGDLLFNRTNSRDLVGKTSVWNNDVAFAYAGYLIRIRFDPRKAVSEYISSALNSKSGKSMLYGMAKPAVNMSNISATDFKRIRLPLPPLDIQLKYSKVVEKISSRIKVNASLLKEADILFQSISQRAFKGNI